MESIKERISRFNSGSVTSLNREEGTKVASRPSSGYSDFSEKMSLFEAQEEIKASKISLVSVTSSESELFAPPPRQSSSEYSDHEEKKNDIESQHEDVSEVTEHQDTVRERMSDRETSGSEGDVDRKKQDVETSGSSSEDDKAINSAVNKVTARPISSDYSDIFDKNEVEKCISTQKIGKGEKPKSSSSEEEKEKVQRQYSSSSEEQNDDKMMQHSSSESSGSKPKSEQELTRQDAFEVADNDKKVSLRRKQSSSEYSESDAEGRKAVDSSSDYDSAPKRGKRRPDSIMSDTSSDYDSLSNVGSRRPASYLLDDEYDVITEEGESKAEKVDGGEDDSSSSSESEGPDVKDAGKKIKRIPPPGILKESSGEDEGQDGKEDQSTTFIPQTLFPQPTQSSMASSSFLNEHVEQSSSVTHSVDMSSVTVSSSLEKYQSSNITKNVGSELTEKRSYQEETLVTSKTSTTTTNIAQAKNDGSSLPEPSQGPDQASTSDDDN